MSAVEAETTYVSDVADVDNETVEYDPVAGSETVMDVPVVLPVPLRLTCVAVPVESPVTDAVTVTSVPVVARVVDADVVMEEMAKALASGIRSRTRSEKTSVFL